MRTLSGIAPFLCSLVSESKIDTASITMLKLSEGHALAVKGHTAITMFKSALMGSPSSVSHVISPFKVARDIHRCMVA